MADHAKKAKWGLVAAGLVFAVGAFSPAARGGDVNSTLLVLAVLFLVIGLKKVYWTRTTPPAA